MKQIFYKLFENLKQLGIKPSIGSRTNVTPIPGSEIDRIINRPVAPKEFDYSKPEVVDSIRGIVKNASDYVGQFTERQAKTFNDNIERILNVIKPKETTADVVDLATKEKITGPGLESLMKEKGVPSISRKTIEAETLIKQFLDDDLISLNAKQIDQLSRGKAEDVFENIFGSKAKELITGKNTNESLNEVYKKLKTTKDVKGRLPDDPSFDPSDIEFKEGGSVSEDVRQLLKEEFIKIINEDPEAYPDTNAGFRRFLKRCHLKIAQATVDCFDQSVALLALECWTSLAPEHNEQSVHYERIQIRRKNLTSVQEKKHDSNKHKRIFDTGQKCTGSKRALHVNFHGKTVHRRAHQQRQRRCRRSGHRCKTDLTN